MTPPGGGPPDPSGPFWARILESHRSAWQRKGSLRHAYELWFRTIADRAGGRRPVVEVGSGGDFLRPWLPGVITLDRAPIDWIDVRADAHALPFRDATCGALVAIDVLHHLTNAGAFLRESRRVLKPGGRLILVEPFVTPFSFPIYRFFHPEGLPPRWEPLNAPVDPDAGSVFSNQRACKEIFWRSPSLLQDDLRGLRISERRLVGFLGYCLSGGFSGPNLWPRLLWAPVDLLDRIALRLLPRLVAMRALVVLEREGETGDRKATQA